MARGSDPERRRWWRSLMETFDPQRASVAEFCREHEVSTASFYAWRRRLGEGGGRAPAFVPVEITREPAREAAVQIHLPGGIRVEVPTGDRELLVELIARLASAVEEGAR